MDKVTGILEAVRTLSRDERRRLVLELEALEVEKPPAQRDQVSRYAALRALAGTAHSDCTDLSTNKYEHVAASVTDHKSR